MIYAYRCTRCGARTERQAPLAERNRQACGVCGVFVLADSLAGILLERDYAVEKDSRCISIPKNLHTAFSDVHGKPGSPQREQFDADVKAGKIVYAGPGSRWV